MEYTDYSIVESAIDCHTRSGWLYVYLTFGFGLGLGLDLKFLQLHIPVVVSYRLVVIRNFWASDYRPNSAYSMQSSIIHARPLSIVLECVEGM